MKNNQPNLSTFGLRPFKLWQDESRSPDLRIEIIPLIDVIFCVLTFFILAAVNLSRQQAINLDLPVASSAVSQMPNMAIVSLTDFGQIYVEKQLIETQDQFTQILTDYLDRNPTGIVVLNASEKRSYQEVIQVLDWLRSLGGERVALGTVSGSQKALQNLDGFFEEEGGDRLNPVTPAIPTVPSLQPNQGLDPGSLQPGGTLPAPPNTPTNNGFNLQLQPPDGQQQPPSPAEIQQQAQ